MGAFDPVPFDVATARRAADACRTAAVRVDEVTGQRRRLASSAQHDWRGPHRDAFDWELTELSLRHDRVAAELRTLAATIDAAISRSAAEDRRRAEAAAAAAATTGRP
jgi:hypothetical protein